MEILSYKDIKSRQNALLIDTTCSPRRINARVALENLRNNYSTQMAKFILEDWRTLDDTEIKSFDKVLELFDLVCENDSVSNIKNIANIIEGNIVHKVRDAKATRHLNNYKLGKFKIANTKCQKHSEDNASAVKRAMSGNGSVGNSLHPNRKYKYDIYGNKIKGTKVEKPNKDEETKEETVKEAVDSFIRVSSINDQCDRVLENYNRLSRTFDVDKIVRNTSYNEDSIEDCVYELCSLIDSYDCKIGVKYNIALEEVLFLFSRNHIDYPTDKIVESVTNYFLMSRDCTDDMIHDMKYIIENNHFYSQEDFHLVDYINESSSFEEEDKILSSEQEIERYLLESKKDKKKEEKIKTSKSNGIKKIIQDFKLSKNKSVTLFKKCVTRLFVNSPENIINEVPDIFTFFRITLAIAAIGLNPVIGAIGTATAAFLKMTMTRKEMERVIKEYKKNRDLYKKKAETTKNNEQKEKYNALVKKLNSDIGKLEDYERNLYTEKENEKRDEERYAKESDIDFNFEVANIAIAIEYLSALVEDMQYSPKELSKTIRNSIKDMTPSQIYDISEAVVLCNNIFDATEIINILEDERMFTRRLSGLYKYEKLDTITECIDMIEKYKHIDLLEDPEPVTVYEAYEQTKIEHDIVMDTLNYISSINESKDKDNKGKGLSFGSKLKLAKEQLKRTAVKLKDKDATISRNIDTTIDHFTDAAKRTMVNNNREAIIRGKLLPSASKCIKAAIVTGAAWLVNPAIAIVGVLGSIAMSKKLQKKERQLILDDIEIEIDMCNRYLKLAEDKDDMKAIRNIMQTKRSLERQQQRLKYNMQVEFKEKVPIKPQSGTHDSYDESYVLLSGVEVQ